MLYHGMIVYSTRPTARNPRINRQIGKSLPKNHLHAACEFPTLNIRWLVLVLIRKSQSNDALNEHCPFPFDQKPTSTQRQFIITIFFFSTPQHRAVAHHLLLINYISSRVRFFCLFPIDLILWLYIWS